MSLNFKEYKACKIKEYFKKEKFVCIFLCAKLNSTVQIKIDQILKKEKLISFKPVNGLLGEILLKSAFKNFKNSVSGSLLFITLKNGKTIKFLPQIKKELGKNLELSSIIVNNKVYSNTQLKKFQVFSYKKNIFSLFKTLDKSLKQSYIFNSK